MRGSGIFQRYMHISKVFETALKLIHALYHRIPGAASLENAICCQQEGAAQLLLIGIVTFFARFFAKSVDTIAPVYGVAAPLSIPRQSVSKLGMLAT